MTEDMIGQSLAWMVLIMVITLLPNVHGYHVHLLDRRHSLSDLDQPLGSSEMPEGELLPSANSQMEEQGQLASANSRCMKLCKKRYFFCAIPLPPSERYKCRPALSRCSRDCANHSSTKRCYGACADERQTKRSQDCKSVCFQNYQQCLSVIGDSEPDYEICLVAKDKCNDKC